MKRALEASIKMLFVLVVFMGFLAVNPQTSSASAKIDFDTTGLSIGADYIMVDGYFFNNGNKEATVKNMMMAVTIYDNQGNQAWYEETARKCTFYKRYVIQYNIMWGERYVG